MALVGLGLALYQPGSVIAAPIAVDTQVSLEPLTFSTPAPARTWFKQEFLFRKYLLSRPEVQGIDEYQATPAVNSFLRKPTAKNPYKKLISRLDSAFTEIPLTLPVVVYRGADEIAIPKSARGGDGQTFVEPGYVSTSILKLVAGRFGAKPKGALMKITVAAGSCAVPADFRGLSRYSEYELILPRATTFTVTSPGQPMTEAQLLDYMLEGLDPADPPAQLKFTRKTAKTVSKKLAGKIKLYEMTASPSCGIPKAPEAG